MKNKFVVINLDTFLTSLENLRFRMYFSLSFIIIFFLLFLVIAKPHLSNTTIIGSDSWDYQTMGVNFALGHGIHIVGKIESYETYKFDSKNLGCCPELTQTRLKENPKFYSFRTPIYPLFIGTTYKLFGINPLIVKCIQLLLLSIIAGFLPLIGYNYWGKMGFISGVIAAPVYLATNYRSALILFTEPLISFVLFLILVSYILYKSKQTKLSAFTLGVSLGLGLLIKGSLIFIPFLLFLYLFSIYYKHKRKVDLRNLLVIFTSFVLTILPWSIFASYQSNSLVILSTQGGVLLLDGNNEDCMDGFWHPKDWVQGWNDGKYLYNRDNMDNYPASYRVANFYYYNYNLLPKIMLNKIMAGFSPFIFLKIFIFLFIIRYYSSLLKRYSSNRMYYLLSSAFLIICLSILNRFNINPITEEHIFPLLLILTIPPLLFYKKYEFKIPDIMVIFFLNFLLLTIILFGDPRFVGVMDFVFILSGVHYLIEYIMKFQKENIYLE